MASADPQERSMLQHAVEYLHRGYPVFPICTPLMVGHTHKIPNTDIIEVCGRGELKDSMGKHPLVRWRGYQKAHPSEDEVRRWWRTWPDANIGFATGQLSEILVLDADGTEARKACLQQGGLDETPTVWTGKVGGAHFHLDYPGGNVRNFARKRPGTDLRGEGGYALLPPSLHASGNRYRWADNTYGIPPSSVPAWLTALIEEDSIASEEFRFDGPIDLDEVVRGIPDGKRDNTLFRYACRLRRDDVPRAEAEALLRAAAQACIPPFPELIAVSKVTAAYRDYQPAQNPTVNDDEYFGPPVAGDGVSAPGSSQTPPGAEPRYPIQSLADLILLNEDDHEQIVDGLIWSHRVTWAFSDPNSGKTLFLLAALMHVAAGRPFCGKPVKQMPVLIFEEDSPLSVIGEYVILLTEIYDFDLATLPIWINKVQGLRITGDEGMAVVRETIDACPQRPGVVLFDACERIVPSDRFNTKELDPFTKTLQRLIGDRITPIVIDHTNKVKAEKGKEETFKANPMERLFGARAKSAISDVMIYFDGFLKTGPVGLVFAKFRGETPATMTLKFDGVTGFDIVESPLAAQNENERLVIRFFNNAGSGEYSVSDVEAGVPLKRRTLERVLSILTKRRWLLASGSTTSRRYRLNLANDSF